MEKTQYGFSCYHCTTGIFPIPVFEALELSKCPNCGATVSSRSDFVFWKCDNCGNHNDYDWGKCHSCEKTKS